MNILKKTLVVTTLGMLTLTGIGCSEEPTLEQGIEEVSPEAEAEVDLSLPELAEIPEVPIESVGDTQDEVEATDAPEVEDGVAEGDFSDVVDADLDVLSTRADRALAWYRNRKGATAWEGWCLRAAANSYGRAHAGYRTAYALWNNRVRLGKAHRNRRPPRGALVFWRTSKNGHVGVADGRGGFWSTSVRRRIGFATLPYFRNYLGWAYKPW